MAISIKNTHTEKKEVWPPEFMPNSGNDIIEKDGRSIYYTDIYRYIYAYIFYNLGNVCIERAYSKVRDLCLEIENKELSRQLRHSGRVRV